MFIKVEYSKSKDSFRHYQPTFMITNGTVFTGSINGNYGVFLRGHGLVICLDSGGALQWRDADKDWKVENYKPVNITIQVDSKDPSL